MTEADLRMLVAVAGEDQAHRVLATALVDEVLLERADGGWPERDELDQARVFCGWREAPDAPESERYYPFQSLNEDLRTAVRRRFFRVPRIGDQPAGEATWFISLYELFALRDPRPHVLIGVRDANDADLSRHAERAVGEIRRRSADMAVIFALPFRDAEAWFVAGIDGTRDAALAARLEDARRALSFHPCDEPHRLTAQPNTAPTDAKRVLRFLLGEGRTLAEAPSAPAPDPTSLAERTLRDVARLGRAEATGLTRFLQQLRDRLPSPRAAGRASRGSPGPPRR